MPRAEISRSPTLCAPPASRRRCDRTVVHLLRGSRRELIRYPETYGVYREAKAEYDREGFFAARRRMGAADFFQLISDTRHYWTDEMRAAIASGKVSAVISDSPIELFPLVLVPEDFLSSNGFRPALITDHFTLWTRTPPAATPTPNQVGKPQWVSTLVAAFTPACTLLLTPVAPPSEVAKFCRSLS